MFSIFSRNAIAMLHLHFYLNIILHLSNEPKMNTCLDINEGSPSSEFYLLLGFPSIVKHDIISFVTMSVYISVCLSIVGHKINKAQT